MDAAKKNVVWMEEMCFDLFFFCYKKIKSNSIYSYTFLKKIFFF